MIRRLDRGPSFGPAPAKTPAKSSLLTWMNARLRTTVAPAVMAAAVLSGSVACSSSSRPAGPTPGTSRYQPRTMEIHPLSHVHIRPDGSAVVEVAVSVLDVDGLPVRAEGVLKMELHQRGRFGDAIMERRTWQRDLRDPADNLRAFDPTTRTYRVPLGLAAEDVPRSPAITATLVRPAAAALSAERSLEVLEPADEAVDAAESDAIPPADSPD